MAHLNRVIAKIDATRTKAAALLDASNFMPVCFIVYMAARTAVLVVRPLDQSSDFLWYYGRAAEIASGSGYAQDGVLTAFWPVGWPGCLAALFAVFGTSTFVGQMANLGFAALVFALTAGVATALFRDRRVGRAAVLLLTLYPNQIGYVPLLSTEIFYEFLLLLAIFLLMRERSIPTMLAGVVFGVATLTKTQTLLVPIFVLLGVFLASPSRRSLARMIRTICVVYVAIMLVMSPWSYKGSDPI
jgi:Gpi18-like mannosyltransferase